MATREPCPRLTTCACASSSKPSRAWGAGKFGRQSCCPKGASRWFPSAWRWLGFEASLSRVWSFSRCSVPPKSRWLPPRSSPMCAAAQPLYVASGHAARGSRRRSRITKRSHDSVLEIGAGDAVNSALRSLVLLAADGGMESGVSARAFPDRCRRSIACRDLGRTGHAGPAPSSHTCCA